ncbi:MAG: P-loop containing nucleoside triphosphate hydrolase protein [Monoraphidium minutum]|nr:MAG: P-loop containing nucleoside triphosphate hydrolase protein [Monoraphidium minutum]
MGGTMSKAAAPAEGLLAPGPPRGANARAAKSVLGELLATGVMLGGLMFALKITLSYMDPYREQRKEAKRQGALLKQRLGRSLVLNEYEQLLASNVLNPHHIDVTLDDIGGLEGVKRDMRLRVLRPLREHDAVSTLLWRPVKGVLLYGPPGTGKTMLAKAMAREADCFFLNITASSVLSKWYGDANKFIRAIFTLASKLEPCVIFIDEVDAFLTKRGGASEHEATLSAKTEFMQLWDGIEGARGMRVLVMGATNRPWCIDDAVLRRFGLQYEVPLPSPPQRRAILLKHVERHEAESRALRRLGLLAPGEGGVDRALLEDRPLTMLGAQPGEGCLSAVVRSTEGYSGSDLTEVCAQAAQDVLAEK